MTYIQDLETSENNTDTQTEILYSKSCPVSDSANKRHQQQEQKTVRNIRRLSARKWFVFVQGK